MKTQLINLVKFTTLALCASTSFSVFAKTQMEGYVSARVIYTDRTWRLLETPERIACPKVLQNDLVTTDSEYHSVLIGFDQTGKQVFRQTIVNPRYIIGEKDREPGSIQYGHDDQLQHVGLAPSITDDLIIADNSGGLAKVELWEQPQDKTPALTIELANIPVNKEVICGQPRFRNDGLGLEQ